MRKNTAHNRIRLWAVVFWLLVWQGTGMLLAARYSHGHLLLATPVDALRCLLQLAATEAFWKSIAHSALRILGGCLASCLAASALAIPAARWSRVRELMAPLVAVIKAVPVASFIILALVWLNSRSLAFFIAFLMVFPPVYLNVLQGICQADKKLLEMAGVFRVSLWRQVRGIYLPAVLPYFRTAASLGLGLCWKAGIAAEVLTVPKASIGKMISESKLYVLTEELFAWTLTVVLLSLLIQKVILKLLKGREGQC